VTDYYFANSISSCGSASLAAVTSEAKQILVSSQSSAGEGTQPSGYERLQTKKLQTVLVD
jgi:hypothetical protein